MRWHKLGLVFAPAAERPWMISHAANPVAESRRDGVRFYFSSRDAASRSSVGWVDVALDPEPRVLRVADEPALSPGERGTFDDSGCSIGCIVRDGERRLLYYMGWNLGVTVPWRNAIGLAVSAGEDQPFVKVSAAPIVDRHAVDPYTLSYPWVVRGPSSWQMWYGSNLAWGADHKDMNHMIKYAESDDGVVWRRDGRVVITPSALDEYAFARPCVLHDADVYRMWYAYRGSAYRVGYAESRDGIAWTRRDREVGIDVSAAGWDAEMIAYPCVFDHRGRRYMAYCGNGFGRTGFGLAVQE